MSDITKNIWTRKLAIEIALECNCTALLDELAVIALNVNDLSIIREHAANAITEIGDKNAKSKLKILLSNPENNLSDELRGYSFTANWPDNISATELFQLISPPKPDSIIGGKYWTFIHHSVAQYLKLEDVPIALDWVFRVSEDNVVPNEGSYTNLIDEVMLLGWNNLEKPEILRPFTLAAVSRIKSYDGIFSSHTMIHLSGNEKPSEMIEKDEKKRYLLVLEMLSLLPLQESFDPRIMVFWPTLLIFPKDFEWLLNIYQTTSNGSQKSAIAHWIVRICDLNNQDQTDILYRLYVTDDSFKEKLSGVFGIVEFDSKQATNQKELYQYEQERKEYASQKLVPSLAERISNLLEKNENGDTSAWWMLNLELTIDEAQDVRHYGNEYERDITELPGWKTSDNLIRERIRLAAKRYVIDGESNPQEWLEKGVYRATFAGYRALRLICKEDNQDLLKLDTKIWQKWAAIISTYPNWGSKKIDECDDTLLIIANQYAFDEIKSALLISIKKENRKENGLIELAHLKPIWSEKLEYVLIRSLKFKSLKNNLFQSILWFLLQNNSQITHEYIIGILQSYAVNHRIWEREKTVIAIQHLVIYSNNPHWEIIWDALMADGKLADDVINALANYHHSQEIFTLLSFNQLSDLYLLLIERYPPEEDPKSILNRDKVREWRDGILNFMANSGEPDGCVALRKLSDKLPKLERFKYLIFKAEFNMRQKTWIPLNGRELLELFLKPDAILIESEQQLLDAIIKSLENLDKLLQGETPQAIFLWNEFKKNDSDEDDTVYYRPKIEERLSDYVKIHLERELKQKGVIVNREVEIRRGEKTDIRVQAKSTRATHSDFDIVTVTVETKGCWHQELEKAMETQLKDRYLKNNDGCRAGLYLIGWFNCDNWDKDDWRIKKIPKYNLSDAKIRLENQAKSLCDDEIILKSYVLDTSIHLLNKAKHPATKRIKKVGENS